MLDRGTPATHVEALCGYNNVRRQPDKIATASALAVAVLHTSDRAIRAYDGLEISWAAAFLC